MARPPSSMWQPRPDLVPCLCHEPCYPARSMAYPLSAVRPSRKGVSALRASIPDAGRLVAACGAPRAARVSRLVCSKRETPRLDCQKVAPVFFARAKNLPVPSRKGATLLTIQPGRFKGNCRPGRRNRLPSRTKEQPGLAGNAHEDGVIAESSQNPTLSGGEERRARIPQWPEAVLEWFRRPNVVAIEGDVFPAERRDMSNEIIGNDSISRAKTTRVANRRGGSNRERCWALKMAVCMKRAPKDAFPVESQKSRPSKRRRSSKPCHPVARRPPKSPACSKFIAEPCHGSFLRRARGSEPASNP